MAISLYEQFTGIDWARYANLSGQVACIACIATAILSIFYSPKKEIALLRFGSFTWTLAVGLVLSIWELPGLYSSLSACTKLRSLCLDDLYIRSPLVRGGLYAFFAVFIVASGTIYNLPGVLLLASALLYGFASINLQADQHSGLFQQTAV